MQVSNTSRNQAALAFSDFGDGAKEAILDIVANPWTAGTFALVTTAGSLLMGQDRFPRLKGATCWVMRDGMKGMYYVGLGVSGARAVYDLSEEDYYGAGHAVTLGASIAVTKYAGDRWMQPFLNRAGEAMMRLAGRAPGRVAHWLRTQGRMMVDAARDRMAASGLALCAHSFDEIAMMVVAAKSLVGWMWRAEDDAVKEGGIDLVSVAVPLPNEDWDGMLPEPPLPMVVAGYAVLGAVMAAPVAVGAAPAFAAPVAPLIEGELVGGLLPVSTLAF